jgi:hypothetical protein
MINCPSTALLTAQQPVKNKINIIEALPGGVSVNDNPGAKPGDVVF